MVSVAVAKKYVTFLWESQQGYVYVWAPSTAPQEWPAPLLPHTLFSFSHFFPKLTSLEIIKKSSQLSSTI